MNYDFGAAKAAYALNEHPRLLLSADDLRVIRGRVGSGTAAKLMRDLRQRVAPLIDRVLACDDLDLLLSGWMDTWTQPGTTVVMGLEDLAFVARVDENEDAVTAVRLLLAHAPTAERPKSQPRKVLGISAGDRLALAYDLLQPCLDATERERFCSWARRSSVLGALQALGPNQYLRAGGNIGVHTMLSGLDAALAICGEPGAGDLEQQITELTRRFEAALYAAIGPDGYPEEDMGYGPSVVARLHETAEMLRRAGRYDVYRACPRFNRFGNAMLHCVQPWGDALSNTGDHGDDMGTREFVLARLAQETQAPELLWLLQTLSYDHGRVHPGNSKPDFYRETTLGAGRQVPATTKALLIEPALAAGKRPARQRPTAFCDRGRGIVSLRSDWSDDATFVIFDGSQRHLAAQGHAHASCGHFSLSALGEYFSIDTGRYNIEQSCHSVVLINGKSGRSTNGEWQAVPHGGTLIAYQPGKLVDAAAVDSSLQHDCLRAQRHLFLVKGSGVTPYVVVVDDLNACNDWAEYWWQLQTSPENEITLKKRSAAIRGWRHGNLLDVHFALPSRSEYPRPHALSLRQDTGIMSSTNYFADLDALVAEFPRPALMVHGPVYKRPRLLAVVEGYNGRMLSALVPRQRGTRTPRYRQLSTLPGALAFSVSFAAHTDTFIFAFEHHLLEAGEIRGRGLWCLVRQETATGKVTAHATGDGDCLRVGNRDLRISR